MPDRPEGTNGTRLVRMREDLFVRLADIEDPHHGHVITWGEPTETVLIREGTTTREEPVYAPRVASE